MQAMSITHASASDVSHREDNQGDPVHVRYQSIPWQQHRQKQLTTKMALFCLCLVAGYGPRAMGHTFAALGSWALESYPERILAPLDVTDLGIEDEPGESSVGNETNSGEASNTGESANNAQYCTVNEPEASTYSSFITFQGRVCIRRSTLTFDSGSQCHWYRDTSGAPQWMQHDQPVYDERTRDWGLLRGQEWFPSALMETYHQATTSTDGGGEWYQRGKSKGKESRELEYMSYSGCSFYQYIKLKHRKYTAYHQ
jgi:hypothetical protein